MKNIEWLKEEASAVLRGVFNNHALDYVKYIEVKGQLERLFDQLDEPEVLLQELPVIPKFVAEWIEELKQDERPLYSVMSSLMNKTNHEWAVWKSANKNFSEIVAQAWLDGYTVGEEQKYYVVLEENSYGAMGLGIGREGRLTFTATHDKWSLPKLTEQEIKDYDERFWPFAVKVEELEE